MSAKRPFSLAKKASSRLFFQFMHCYPVWIQLQVTFLSSCLVQPYDTCDCWHNLQTDILDHFMMWSETSITLSFVKTLSLLCLQLICFPKLVNQPLHQVVMSYVRVTIHVPKFLFGTCYTPSQQNTSHQKTHKSQLTMPFAQHTTMHPSCSLFAAQLVVNAQLGLHDRSHMFFMYGTFPLPTQCHTLLAQMHWHVLLTLYF